MGNKDLYEKLYNAAVKELTEFENSLDTVEKALNAAYELSVKRDILSYIENELNDITSAKTEAAVNALIDSGSPLSTIYDEWLGNEYDNRMEAIKMTTDDIIDITAEKAADREMYEKNIIIQTKFPYENNVFPNDITYNEDSNSFSWVYFNPDGDGGDGEFIDITITDDDVLVAYSSNNFLEYIYQNCKQNVIDTHSGYFEDYAKAYINKDENVVRKYDELTIQAYLENNSPQVQKAKKALEGEISADSDSLIIDGYEGTWYVIDTETVDGKELFLLESEDYGDETFGIIIDKNRNVLVDEAWNGFSDYHEKYDIRIEAIKMTVDDEVEHINADKARENHQIASELLKGSYNFTVISFDGGNKFAVDEYVTKDDPAIFELDEFKDYVASQDKSETEVEVNASFYIIGEGGEESDAPSEEQLQYINEHLETVLDKADLLESNTFSVDISEIEREKTFAEENKYIFTMIEFETGDTYIIAGVVDDNNIKDTSAWKEVKNNCFNIDEVEDLDEGIKVTYDVYNANIPEAVVPTEEQLQKITNNIEDYMFDSHTTEEGYVYAWKDCDDIIFAMKQQWEEIHETNPSVSDSFDNNNFLFPKEPKVIARFENKEKYNLDDSIEQIKLNGKEWLDVFDACIEMNRRGVDIKDIEMLNVRCITNKGEYSNKDMTPEMYVVYHTRTDEHSDKFKAAIQSFDAKHTVLYKKSFAEAEKAEEIDLYRKSNKVNQTCAHMIDAVTSSHYENNRFHAKDALDDIMERGYAIERIALVVAVNIADKDWDRRLSNTNISWANEYLSDFPAEMKERRKGEYYTTMHPGLLNMFVDSVREEMALRQETYIDKLNNVADIADKISDVIDNGGIGKEEQTKNSQIR